MRRAFRRALQGLAAASVFGLLVPALAQTPAPTTVIRQAPAGPPPAFGGARPTGEPAIEARVEMAWMAHPGTFTSPLNAVVTQGILEAHGDVPNEAARQMALTIARANCSLMVADHLRIRPFVVRQPAREVVASLTTQAQETLRNMLGPAAGAVRVQVAENGQITLSGPVATPEQKVEVVRRIHRVNGCTGVVNQLVLDTPAPPKRLVVTHVPTILPPPPTTTAMARPSATGTSYLQRADEPDRHAAPVPTGRIDLLSPPAPTTTGQQAEEMHWLQLPAIPGSAPKTAANKTRAATIARTTQFAALGTHVELAAPGQAVPVPTAPLGLTATAVPASTPQPGVAPLASNRARSVVTFAEPQEEPLPLPKPLPKPPTAQPVPEKVVPALPATHLALRASTLKKRIQSVCGKQARSVLVTPGRNLGMQEILVVQILVPSAAAEERITPRLLAMPEMNTGQIRLEIHVPQ